MKPEELDELFRKNLQDKPTPLPAPLWDRLQEKMQAHPEQTEHSVDKLFRSKLESHPTPLPPDLWNRLEERMNPGAAKTRPMWVWYAAACLALLLSVTGLWRYQQTQHHDLVAVANKPATEGLAPEAGKPNKSQPTASQYHTAPLASAQTPAAEAEAESGTEPRAKAPAAAKETESRALVARSASSTARTQAGQPAQHQPQPNKAAAPKPETPAQLAANQPEKQKEALPEYTEPAPQLAQAGPLKVNIILASAGPAAAQPEQAIDNSKGAIAKRVAKQLLKLKNGEKPDLQEFGIASSYTMQLNTRNQTLSRTINL